MENTLPRAGIIRTAGMVAGPLRADLKLPMFATCDIGAAAADALLSLNFRQKQTRELLGQRDVSMTAMLHQRGGMASIVTRFVRRAEQGRVRHFFHS